MSRRNHERFFKQTRTKVPSSNCLLSRSTDPLEQVNLGEVGRTPSLLQRIRDPPYSHPAFYHQTRQPSTMSETLNESSRSSERERARLNFDLSKNESAKFTALDHYLSTIESPSIEGSKRGTHAVYGTRAPPGEPMLSESRQPIQARETMNQMTVKDPPVRGRRFTRETCRGTNKRPPHVKPVTQAQTKPDI